VSPKTKIGLIGDRDDSVTAHRAIAVAMRLAADALDCPLDVDWLATERLIDFCGLATYDGLWCVPASPYRNLDGALRAIRVARELEIPFLGTCGGFQHALLEFARNVLNWTAVGHAEIDHGDPEAALITPLECALVEVGEDVRFASDSNLAAAYGTLVAREHYHCRYGLNPRFGEALFVQKLRPVAWNARDEVRAVELIDHPFFVATLFQPERAALDGQAPNLAVAFASAAIARARTRRCAP
jgi:CTP synthase (UTP-ammonia lyase)